MNEFNQRDIKMTREKYSEAKDVLNVNEISLSKPNTHDKIKSTSHAAYEVFNWISVQMEMFANLYEEKPTENVQVDTKVTCEETLNISNQEESWVKIDSSIIHQNGQTLNKEQKVFEDPIEARSRTLSIEAEKKPLYCEINKFLIKKDIQSLKAFKVAPMGVQLTVDLLNI